MEVTYSPSTELEALLKSVDRPGDYFAHGRSFHPMPRIAVDGVGVLSFPVPDAQIRALIGVAERAPYGRGPDTRVDTSVRDCRQIGATRMQVAGRAWPETFARILGAAGEGLGCPVERLDAHLYKLLIYEQGGFFAPHSDTEKADGMVATLSLSLPAAGAGGELVVRHGGRETVIDMQAEEPSELAFAAFYADCEHESRPVRDGHRLSLVFNLCLRPGDTGRPPRAPDHDDRVADVAERLAELGAGGAGDKLVWALEHQYTEAGLSFDVLKNGDAAVARVLGEAAARAGCVCHAAIVHVQEQGEPTIEGEYVDSWSLTEQDAGEMEIDEVFDTDHWLDGWIGREGSRPAFERIPLLAGELLPRGSLDGAEPDRQWLREATGNEGITLQRAYRRAALVVWPRAKTLEVMASAGVGRAVAWLTEERRRAAGTGDPIEPLVSRLIDIWPSDDSDPEGMGGSGRYNLFEELGDEGEATSAESVRAEMLRLLAALGDASLGVRFLDRVVRTRYAGGEHDALLRVIELIGPRAAAKFLPDFLREHFANLAADNLTLLREIGELEPAGAGWRDALRDALRAVFQALPAALAAQAEERSFAWLFDRRQPLDEGVVRDLFALAWRCGLPDEAETAARAIGSHPRAVSPQRILPAALNALRGEAGLPATAVYASLWRQAADALLDRSSTAPEEPRDWKIAADLSCDCDLCGKLRAFCEDPAARQERFQLREDLRSHIERTIERDGLDLDRETDRQGRPHTLVCTKNRASHARRLEEYGEDVSCMRTLLESAPARPEAGTLPPEVENDVERLRQAVAAAAGSD